MKNIAPHRVVVIGGGYAGLTAAARICENTTSVSLALIDAKPEFVEQVWSEKRGAVRKEYICHRTLAGIGFATELGPRPDTTPQIS